VGSKETGGGFVEGKLSVPRRNENFPAREINFARKTFTRGGKKRAHFTKERLLARKKCETNPEGQSVWRRHTKEKENLSKEGGTRHLRGGVFGCPQRKIWEDEEKTS